MQSLAEEIIGQTWGLLIDGATATASDGGSFDVFAPANGTTIATVSAASVKDVDTAVQSAHKAFLQWSKQTAYEREKIIRKATAFVRTQADRIGAWRAGR